MGIKGVQKGSKRGSKGGPKIGPPEVRTKKKSKNIFSLAPLQGFIGAPPLKYTILGRYQPLRPRGRRFPEKSAVFSLRRMVQRGRFPHFFSKIGDNGVWRGATLLKNWSKGGYFYFGHFLAIVGISGENGVPGWSPRGCTPVEKTVRHLS